MSEAVNIIPAWVPESERPRYLRLAQNGGEERAAHILRRMKADNYRAINEPEKGGVFVNGIGWVRSRPKHMPMTGVVIG